MKIVVRTAVTGSLSAWTGVARMLSSLADFPFLKDFTVASSSLPKTRWSSSVSVWG